MTFENKIIFLPKRLWGSFSAAAFSHPSPATAMADNNAETISSAVAVAEHLSDDRADEGIVDQINSLKNSRPSLWVFRKGEATRRSHRCQSHDDVTAYSKSAPTHS